MPRGLLSFAVVQRAQVLAFFADVKPCLIGMEACGTAHFWGAGTGGSWA